MRIAGLQKLTLLDYPGKTACTLFTPGCNMRCPFCHNASLVLNPGEAATLPEEEFFAFLKKRQRLLDAVCISGGEPLLQLGLSEFIKKIKALDYLVKLDSNGSFPVELKKLVLSGDIDYVAMDVKNSLARYPETVGLPNFDTRPIKESVAFLMEARVDYEFRTTVLKNFHGEKELTELAEWLKPAPLFALQSYKDSGDVLRYRLNAENPHREMALHGYSEEEMKTFFEKVQQIHPNVVLRG